MSLTRDQVQSTVWWVDEDGSPSPAHLAIAHALIAGPGWTATAGRVLLVPPFRWIAAVGYPLVSRWRHRLPGGTPACEVRK